MDRKKSVLTIIVFVAVSVIIGLVWRFILAEYFIGKPAKPFDFSAKRAGLAEISIQLTSGIVGYWNFDDGSGTTAADSSGSGNNGTLVNGPVWTDGMVGGALSFNGTNSYVDFGDKAPFKFTNNDFSISLWFKTPTTSIKALVSKGTTSGGGANYVIQLNYPSTNKLTVYLGNSACNGWLVNYDLTATFVTDQWTHIVVTKSGTATVLYKNGVQVDTYTLASDTLCDNFAPLRVGTRSDGGQYLLGLTDELRIYSRALNASEVTELYNYSSPDLNPPILSNSSPAGTLAAGTVQTTLSVTTNENATCRYSTTAGTPYASMTNTFSTTGGVSHSTTISGLADGTAYNYYIRCQDTIGNVTPGDYVISFLLGSVSAPIISGMATPQVDFFRVKIIWTTDKTSDSQVEYGLDATYGSNTAILSKLDTNHVMVVSALAPNTAYHYRVKSRDASGNLATSNDFIFTTSAPPSNNLDKYGGDPLIRGTATGFFHLEKIANHWLLIDPLGNAYWFIGPARAGVSAKGTDPTTGMTSGNYINAKYNNDSTVRVTQDKKRLWSWGFTGIGMYESPIIRSYRDIYKRPVVEPILPHFNTRRFANKALGGGVVKNLTNELPNGGQLPDVFDPAFRTSAFNTINQTASGDGLAAEVSSPWVIGWITDESDDFTGTNEGGRFGWTVLATAPYRASGTYFGTPFTYTDTKVYTKFTLQSFLQSRYTNNIVALNAAWGSNYTTWDSNGGWGVGSGWLDEKGTHSWVGNQNTLAGETAAMQKDLKDFVTVFMKQYYQTVYDAIRSVDTNHMIFGPVAGGSVNSIPEMFLGAKDYVDGLFIAGAQDLSSGNAIVPYEQMGRPFFACCSFVSSELDSPLAYLFPSWAGGGAPPGPTYFNTQEQRGQYYAQFINKIVNLKDADQTYPILGFHWWEEYDDLSEKRNYGYDSFRDNAYDGFENIMATSTDQWGYVVGGEDKNYGNFLGFAIAATKGAFTTLEQITAGVTPPLDVTPPTVAVTSPAQGSTLSGTITLSASASDNVAVKSVQFNVDGTIIGSPLTASPYTYSFDTKTLSNGSHSLSALAKDTSWNTATAPSISVTVSNQAVTTTPPPATSGGGVTTQTPSTPTISTTITAQPSGGGGGGVIPSTTSQPRFKNNLSLGSRGDDVTALQSLLIKEGVYPEALVTGYYGNLTTEAVKRLQAKYNLTVSGNVDQLTLNKINQLSAQQVFTKALYRGLENPQVTLLQQLLIKEDVYPEALVIGYFGPLTEKAVQRFQVKYQIVSSGTPLTTGFGVVGPKTRAKLNIL